MLTKELAIAEFEGSRVLPDRLNRRDHSNYAAIAESMLEVYRTGVGRTRSELHRAVHSLFAKERHCPVRRIDAFCKLLDDASVFARESSRLASTLRRTVFRRAALHHPLTTHPDRQFPHDEAIVKAAIAAQFGKSWPEIEGELFGDVLECQRLESFLGYASALALLARYNVAQVQVALFRAVEMIIWATDDFKTILRYAKLARLMHSIRLLPDGCYEIRLDGPASALRDTRRYGTAFAKFLPALIACKGWRMHAVLQTRRRGWLVSLDLSNDDRLNSHLPAPQLFDSRLEEQFARSWGEKRGGWSLCREGEILHQGQKVFIPDFVLHHDDGRKVLLEIVGYWTPEYLDAKFKTLRTFEQYAILLAVGKAAHARQADLPPGTVQYKTTLRPDDVLRRIEATT
jgi:predicted nuclease of restriction endonuclease-like RecB superfamily